MEFMLNLNLPKAAKLINHRQKILSVGSCFTEHIGNALKELKFEVLQNPNGILFDPASVCSSLLSYIKNDPYPEEALFYLHELWHSWQHHSRFSGRDKEQVLQNINASQTTAHHFLEDADWLIITLGSAFSYRLISPGLGTIINSSVPGGADGSVANCHRAPAQNFQKHLLPVNDIIDHLDYTIQQLFHFNQKLNIIFTISPVRHIRDGVVDNNRSKARLIESVHNLVDKSDKLFYFPAYELVIDILRDYRFYDVDMVHPNYPATDFVLQKFLQAFTSDETKALGEEIKKLVIARKHRSANPDTEAHAKFLQLHSEKARRLTALHPYLNFEEEITFFSTNSKH